MVSGSSGGDAALVAAGQPWGLHSIVLFEMPRKRFSSSPYRPELLNQSFLDLRSASWDLYIVS